MDFTRYQDFEVDGRNVQNVTHAFRLFPEVALRVFARRGIGRTDAAGQLILGEDAWYPLAPWLEGFHEIANSVGPSKMFEIGRQVPKNSPFPPTIQSIQKALESVDVAYHMNHRRKGRVMFDPDTGEMLEGIGHYRAHMTRGATGAVVESHLVPYPCELDRGLLATLATRFEPNATVVHSPGTECRRNGADRCTYVVAW